MNKHLLLILDGYGIAEDASVSAIDAARTPFLDELFAEYPHGTLDASGQSVGLPEGQMGNSEVGHMNLGAGRVVHQEITRINRAIGDGAFFEVEELRKAAGQVKAGDGKLHLIGLLSDGGVHSSIEHLYALLEMARLHGLRPEQVCVHAFTDGRDTDPHGGKKYVEAFMERAKEIGVGRIASITGRYYAMDRDRRWERTAKAYRLLVYGEGEHFDDPVEAVRGSCAEGVTDEFIQPRTVGDEARVRDGDSVIFYNFRADRARQLTRALTGPGFDGFERGAPPDIYFASMSPYDETFGLPVAFPKVNLERTLGEIISDRGGRQLRIAESEKCPHVTYFFSGGREDPFEGEERIVVASPKVATSALQPEMGAPEVADKAAGAIAEEKYNLVVLNFANPDMVGHTGVFEAAVKAVEAGDAGSQRVVEAALAHGYGLSLIADHGNADKMKNADGSPHTAHTTVLVPHLIIKDGFRGPVRHGKLADVAPTILALMGEEAPGVMDGEVLV